MLEEFLTCVILLAIALLVMCVKIKAEQELKRDPELTNPSLTLIIYIFFSFLYHVYLTHELIGCMTGRNEMVYYPTYLPFLAPPNTLPLNHIAPGISVGIAPRRRRDCYFY
jgi:hypothetical protein